MSESPQVTSESPDSKRLVLPSAAPLRPTQGRLVVRSIGTASFALVDALRSVLTLTDSEIAQRLFRAPAVLIDELRWEQAEAVAAELARAGLEVAVEALDAPFAPGDARCDLILDVHDFTRLADLGAELVRLLGVDARTAREMLCAVPCTLVGGVSEATARALSARFARLGATVCASTPMAATFDLFVIAPPGVLRRRLLENLSAAGVALPFSPTHDPGAPVVLADLTRDVAEQLWELAGRRADLARVFDRAFERFDVVLHAAADTPALREALALLARMPDKVIARVLGRLPIVVLHDVNFAAMQEAIEQLTRAGATVTSELIALQSFSLEVTACTDRQRAAAVLRALIDLRLADGEALLARLPSEPARVDGPLSHARARWLQAELKAVGTTATLVKHKER